MRLSRTPSLIFTSFVIVLGLIAQDARAAGVPTAAETRLAK